MGFILWHYLARFGIMLFFPLLLVAFLAPGNAFTNTVGGIAGVGFVALGVTGAVLAVRLLFTKFRFACPKCSKHETDLGVSKNKAMWLYCPHCGLFEETGFLKLKVTHREALEAASSDAKV